MFHTFLQDLFPGGAPDRGNPTCFFSQDAHVCEQLTFRHLYELVRVLLDFNCVSRAVLIVYFDWTVIYGGLVTYIGVKGNLRCCSIQLLMFLLIGQL